MFAVLPAVPAPLDFNGADTDLLGLSEAAGFFGVTPFGGGAEVFAVAVLLTPVATTLFCFFGAATPDVSSPPSSERGAAPPVG